LLASLASMFISWFNGTHIFLIISGKNCLTPNFNAPKYLQGTHFPENPHWKKCATFKNTTVYDGCPVKKYMVFDQMSSTFIELMQVLQHKRLTSIKDIRITVLGQDQSKAVCCSFIYFLSCKTMHKKDCCKKNLLFDSNSLYHVKNTN